MFKMYSTPTGLHITAQGDSMLNINVFPLYVFIYMLICGTYMYECIAYMCFCLYAFVYKYRCMHQDMRMCICAYVWMGVYVVITLFQLDIIPKLVVIHQKPQCLSQGALRHGLPQPWGPAIVPMGYPTTSPNDHIWPYIRSRSFSNSLILLEEVWWCFFFPSNQFLSSPVRIQISVLSQY